MKLISPFQSQSMRSAWFLRIVSGALPLALLAPLVSVGAQRSSSRGSSAPPPASTSASPTADKGYNAFKLVRTRNIFDPERRPIRTDAPATTASKSGSSSNSSRVSRITLTGTMVTAGRSLAFFSGSQNEFKVLPINDKISGFTIKAITSAYVDLEKDGKPYNLAVGRQLTLDGQNISFTSPPPPSDDSSSAPPAPAPSGTDSGSAPTATSNTPSPSNPASPAPPAAGGDKAEILRRMMERRQKEVTP